MVRNESVEEMKYYFKEKEAQHLFARLFDI